MRSLLVASALLAVALIPATAAADNYLCQPHFVGTTCVTVIDSDGWAYFEACNAASTGYACVGGGHWDYSPTPYIGNGLGLETCEAGFCGGAVVGEEAYFGSENVYAGAGGFAGSTGAVVLARAGTNNGAPFATGGVCYGTPATGAACVLA